MQRQNWVERLARYQFLEPLTRGCSVLEVGSGTGRGAEFLASSAREVIALEPSGQEVSAAQQMCSRKNLRILRGMVPSSLEQLEGPFDVIILPELQRWADHPAILSALNRLLGAQGVLVILVPSIDQDAENGASYENLSSWLQSEFAHIRIYGEIPFVGKTIADFAPSGDLKPALDCSLVAEDEPPTDFLVLCSHVPFQPPSYTILQLPYGVARRGEALSHIHRHHAQWGDLASMASGGQDTSRVLALVRERDALLARLEGIEPLARANGTGTGVSYDSATVEGLSLAEIRAAHRHETERARAAEQRCERLMQQIDEGAREREPLRRRIAELEAGYQAAQWRIDELRGQVKALEDTVVTSERQVEQETSESSESLLRIREQQLEALLRGAAAHKHEAETWGLRIAELSQRVVDLETERGSLRTQLATNEIHTAEERERAEALRRELSQLGRELARARGELERYQVHAPS